MNKLEILRLVFREGRPSWSGAKQYSYEAFRQDLGSNESENELLSDSQISALLNGRPGTSEIKFLSILSDQVCKRIEVSLGLKGLFACSSRAEVLSLLEERDGAPNKTEAKLRITKSSDCVTDGLVDEEIDTLQHLVDYLVQPDIPTPILHLSCRFNTGASAIANGLGGIAKIREHYDEIAYLRPSDFAFPFQTEFASLASYLESPDQLISTRHLLVDAIKKSKILVVVYSVYCIDFSKDGSWLKQVIKELKFRSNDWDGPVSLLLVGESDWIFHNVGQMYRSPTELLLSKLRVHRDRRFDEFKAQWARFRNVTGSMRSEESGSRMRRAKTYYSMEGRKEVWPISIKTRALFASNYSTFSYFDPTQGFRRLAGEGFEKFDDIYSYYLDVVDYVDYQHFLDKQSLMQNTGKRTYFYNLQYVSTALNWLTDDALECLLRKIPPIRPNSLSLATEIGRIRDHLPAIDNRPETVGKTKRIRFFANLAIRAVVQDHWRINAPYLRSLAHWRIAKRLLDNQNNKELLSREYPYPPLWGRSRIYFLSEAIRHLIRSCETSLGEPISHQDSDETHMPDEPLEENRGTSPFQTINFCFEFIYQSELNGNSNGRTSRNLAKRYGAYHLALELLELMSDGQRIGHPHKSLKAKHRVPFVRECAFALFDVGELDRATLCFERAIDMVVESEAPLDALELKLDLVLVKSVAGRLREAEEILAECSVKLRELHEIYSSTGRPTYFRVRQLFRRTIGRGAHLKYLQGNTDGAISEMERITSEEPWEQFKQKSGYGRDVLVPSFKRNPLAEQKHLLIACLRSVAKREGVEYISVSFASALNLCLAALLQAQSLGLQHESMGFRIVLARLMRRLGQIGAAETILDAVHADILQFGCSERTFLAFLNDAGKVLSELGEPLRAYATYLRPCMWRASSRGFARETLQAAENAKDSLDKAYAIFSGGDGSGAGGEIWSVSVERALAGHRRLLGETDELFRGAPFEKDPLYAYAIVDAEGIIKGLRTPEDFAAARAEIDTILNAMANDRSGRGGDVDAIRHFD